VDIQPRKKGLHIDLKELWRYRDLTYLLARRTFVAMYKQTILGPAWALLQPLLTTGIFTVVFGMLVGIRTEGPSAFLFYLCGSVPWNFFARCLEKTAQTFTDNEKLFGKVYFPRLCAPIATVLVTLINFAIQGAFFILCLLIGKFISGLSLSVSWGLIALTPLVVLEMALLGLGAGIAVSALTVRYKDLALLVGFGVSLWMYISPVAYPASVLKESYPLLKTLLMLNPMTPIIEFFRAAYLGTGQFSALWLLISCSMTLIVFLLGLMLFNRVEKTFADVI
ncbi:MAG: ABC transporter permease, partial [Clostridia bacterium]|nr:ABC transporter permease [Clostridia bacterium]